MEKIEQIANHYGLKNQLLKTIEEITELLIALKSGDKEKITEEIADVDLMMAQIDILTDNWLTENKSGGYGIAKIQEMKMDRQLERISEEKAKLIKMREV